MGVFGAGLLWCEVEAGGGQKGCMVRMHEALEQPFRHVLGRELGNYLAQLHRSHCVDLRVNVTELPQMPGPVLAGGGSVPRTELAEGAGLGAERGIVVDERW